MDQQQEQEVARGLRQGNTEAWRVFYNAHAERVWCLAARLMPTSSEVADVVQETFLAAARSAQNYDSSRGSLWNWLSGIARNHVALHYRDRQRQNRFKRIDDYPLDGRQKVSHWLDNREAAPPEAFARAELAGLIRATLTELPADYEQLLTAKYIDDASIKQIATAEDCSQEAVRSKLARARRAFRRVFTKSSTSSTGDRAERTS